MQTLLEPGNSGYPGFEFSGHRAPNRPPTRGRRAQPLYNKNRNFENQERVEQMLKNARNSGTGKLGSPYKQGTRVGSHYQTLRTLNADGKKKAVNHAVQGKLQIQKLMNSIAKIPEWNKLPTNTKRIILGKINRRLANMV